MSQYALLICAYFKAIFGKFSYFLAFLGSGPSLPPGLNLAQGGLIHALRYLIQALGVLISALGGLVLALVALSKASGGLCKA